MLDDSYESFVGRVLAELDFLAAPKAKARLQELLEATGLAEMPREGLHGELHKRIEAWNREVAKFLRKNPHHCWNTAVPQLRSRGGKWDRLYSDWERSLQIQKLLKET